MAARTPLQCASRGYAPVAVAAGALYFRYLAFWHGRSELPKMAEGPSGAGTAPNGQMPMGAIKTSICMSRIFPAQSPLWKSRATGQNSAMR
eukprot:6368818-Pyramimonas_sp.AAC.1